MHDKRVQNKLFTLEHVLPLCVVWGRMKRDHPCWSWLISFKAPTELCLFIALLCVEPFVINHLPVNKFEASMLQAKEG